MQIVVVVNGVFAHPERLLAVLHAADLVIAADGGANWLHAHGLAPQVLIGDLDSVQPNVLAALSATRCTVLRYSPHKDETDTELALLYAAEPHPERITLLGALGGRVDHELANLMLLALPALTDIPTAIYDGVSWITMISAGTRSIAGVTGDLVSLLPWGGDCLGVTTNGLAYPLHDETLPFGPARGVSNVMLGAAATVSVRSGRLLVIHTPAEPAP